MAEGDAPVISNPLFGTSDELPRLVRHDSKVRHISSLNGMLTIAKRLSTKSKRPKYPGSSITIPEVAVTSWSTLLPTYKPVFYEAPHIAQGYGDWLDPSAARYVRDKRCRRCSRC